MTDDSESATAQQVTRDESITVSPEKGPAPVAAAETATPPPQPYSIYTGRQKTMLVVLVSVAATFSGFAGNIYFSSIPTIAKDLNVSEELVNLTVTAYMIFQGISPTLWGAMSDTHGRRLTYICTFIVFLGACIGLAETKSYAQLVVLRCLQSTGSASTIAIGAGVIGDITTREERGGYMGFFQAGLLLPTAIAPLIGGALSDSLGWRSIFWFLTIYGGAFLVLLILILPETLRSLVGNGSIPPRGAAKSPLASYQQRRLHRLSTTADNNETGSTDQPSGTLEKIPSQAERITSNAVQTKAPKKRVDIFGSIRILTQLQATFAILFVAVYYTVWQMVIPALSTLFESTYGLSDTQVGLVYIANGGGCIMGTALTGKFLDYDYRRIRAKFVDNMDNFPLEQARLRTVWLYAPVQWAAVLIFGWTVDKAVHMAVPIICVFFLGWTAVSIQSIVSTFLVDCYPDQGASATAALNLVRCLLGAGGISAVLPLISAIGAGWTMTLLVGIMVLGTGLVAVQLVWGPEWRRSRERQKKQVQA